MTETSTVLINTSIGIIGIIITAIVTWALKAYDHKRKQNQTAKRKETQTERLRAISTVYLAMEALKRHEDVDRVLMIEITNEGHQPRPGCVLWGRAIKAEVVESITSKVTKSQMMQDYEHFRLDRHYIDMTADLIEKGFKDFVVEDMDEGILRNYYLSEEVTYSKCYLVHIDLETRSTFIMSVATFNEDYSKLLDNSHTKGFIESKVQIIRDSFDKYRKED